LALDTSIISLVEKVERRRFKRKIAAAVIAIVEFTEGKHYFHHFYNLSCAKSRSDATDEVNLPTVASGGERYR
jgi:uncharacterized radical SAM superfamily Fe-S cluster-containing enzyme